MIKNYIQGNIWHDKDPQLIHRMPITTISVFDRSFLREVMAIGKS